ncbi:MAG: acyl-CoA dehydrogenase family protein [Gammaproteobacteria bacterium]|nr:acyl-CoA dehydrogenase family protein [Gammaproteobacteria bacterium]
MLTNFYLDNEDLRFQVEQAFDWSELVALYERDFTDPDGFKTVDEAVEFYRDVLEIVGKFVAIEVAPVARKLDDHHPKLVDGEVVVPDEAIKIFEGLRDMGLYGLNLPRSLGGLNAPFTIYFVISEILGRADPALVGHYGFHVGIAKSLLAYSLKEGSIEHDGPLLLKTRFDKAIAEIASGEQFGCMAMTEPGAGSDLGAILTKGVLDENGTWRLTGQKIFITSGHGQHQLVLAKTEDSDQGLKNLSLFWVPRKIQREGRTINNVKIDRLEEKLGIHASVTTSLSYDNSEAELIGKRGQGFELMLMLMNNARLSVGFECIGLIEGAYRLAREFAAERVSMGQSIDQHEIIADYLEKMEVELKGLRALSFRAVYLIDLHSQLETRLQLAPPTDPDKLRALRRRIKKIKWKARELTPLIKFQASEKAIELSSLALQIHGGVGYTTDYLIEKFVRDAYVTTIYEGTSEIQSLMALKDQLQKALKDLPKFLRVSAQSRVQSLSARDPLQRKLAGLQSKGYGAMQHILAHIAKDKWSYVTDKKVIEWPSAFFKDWDAKRDFGFGLLHAKRLTRILSEVAIAKVLVKQAEQFPERRELAERFLDRAAPVVNWMHDEIHHTGDSVLEKLAVQRSEKQPPQL